MRIRFNATDPLTGQFRDIARAELAAALRIAVDLELTPEKRIHDVRRRMKMTRALLRLVRPGFPDYSPENRAAADAAGGLSQMRDAAVLRQTLSSLLAAADDTRKKDAQRLMEALDERISSDETQQEALSTFAAATAPILERSEHWRLSRDDAEMLLQGAEATYRSGRKAMRLAVQSGTAVDLHEWRKLVKYHLHQIDFMVLRPDGARGKNKSLRRLAKILGSHHDQHVLRSYFSDRSRWPEFAPLDATIEASLDELSQQAFALGEDLFGRKPGAWRERLQRKFEKHSADANRDADGK